VTRYKSALRKYFSKSNQSVVFFERNYKTQHLQIQVNELIVVFLLLVIFRNCFVCTIEQVEDKSRLVIVETEMMIVCRITLSVLEVAMFGS